MTKILFSFIKDIEVASVPGPSSETTIRRKEREEREASIRMKDMLKTIDWMVEDLKKQGIGLDSDSDNSSNEDEDDM